MSTATSEASVSPYRQGARRFVGYPVRLPAFEGPLDLLLYLVEKQRLDIHDIPIALITDQYLGYLCLLEELDLEVTGEFLVMAATLLEIKSRVLLPSPPAPEPEEELDPRAELAARLLEYQRFKQASLTLGERQQAWSMVHSRALTDGEDAGRPYELGNGVSGADLWAAFWSLLRRVPEPAVTRLERPRLTVAMKIAQIVERLKAAGGELGFFALFAGAAARVEVIVAFLALLELIRQGRVRARQRANFGEITLVLMGGEA